MKKILIMYASYGTGHKKIAEYIENYFKENENFEIETIDILKNSTPFLGVLSQKTFEKMNFSIPFLWDFLYNAFNRKLSLFAERKRKESFDEMFCTNYKMSFAGLGQEMRHRTLAFEAYIPEIFKIIIS